MAAGIGTSLLTPLGLLAIVVAVIGSATDLRERRIPNWLTVGAFTLAIVVRVVGAEPVASGLTGAGTAFLVGLSLYVVGAIGAGDVKYLTAFGAILGAGRIWPALMLVALVGGILALLWAVALGRARTLLLDAAGLGLYCLSLGFRGSRRILTERDGLGGTTPIPLGVAIAAGCTLVWFL